MSFYPLEGSRDISRVKNNKETQEEGGVGGGYEEGEERERTKNGVSHNYHRTRWDPWGIRN
ncbi:hypothetical protein RUM43_004263 [Polyplax serrata]|uniref:Uncharacterized protein n=1 Tax=Polyplax serrata TaxID=468196 RepID=A0AAN8XMW3_POLSC